MRGASAVLQKPISRAQLKMSLTNLGLQPKPDETHTVLVVDDDPKAVEVIAAFLPPPAYTVVRAYGGAEAIALAQRIAPDLILLDLMMPGVNGFDVVEALKRDPGDRVNPAARGDGQANHRGRPCRAQHDQRQRHPHRREGRVQPHGVPRRGEACDA